MKIMLYLYYSKKFDDSFSFLKFLVSKKYNIDIDEKDIICNQFGKPSFKNKDLFFNISNTENITVIALSDKEMGIDIENADRKVSKSLIKKYLSEDAKSFKPIKLWTLKESFIKFKGLSTLNELKNIKITENEIFYKDKKQNLNIISLYYKNYFISVVTKDKNYILKEI